MLPLLPEKIEQAAQARREVLLGILQNLRHLVAEVRRSLAEDDATLQQKGTQLVCRFC